MSNVGKKLYIKAKKFIDAGKTVPADLQNKIVSLNEDIQKFVDNTVKKYPLLKDRVNPITIDANDLTVKRGNYVFKQLGIGLVDQNLGDIKIGSIDDLTIKANLAEQTLREAIDSGLIDEKVDVEISKNEKWYEKGITLNVTIGLIVVAVVGYFVYTKYVKK